MARQCEGCWVVKNTDEQIDNNFITLVKDIGQFKNTMLLKVRRGPREKLQELVNSKKGSQGFADFSDSDSDAEEEAKTMS